MKLVIVIVLACAASGSCGEFLSDVFGDCGDNADCMESNFMRKIDEIDGKRSVEILDGFLELKKRAVAEVQGRSAEGIVERVARFIDGHELMVKIPSTLSGARKIIEGARSSKLKKFIVPFVVLMVLKKSIEVPIYLALVSIMAFKGLTAGLIALVLSAATAFKSLLEQNSSSKVSYEVVPQLSPTHWSRSGVDYPNLSSGYHTITQY